MKILICGFMGSGKTYWLEELRENSNNLDFDFLDLDGELATSLKISSSELGSWIVTHGWPLFRKAERELLENFLASSRNGVMSVGGGALSMDLIERVHSRDDVKIVFLNTPFDICYERITGDANRPLTSMKKEELRKLHAERMPVYLQADLILAESERKEIEGLRALVHTLTSSK